MTGRLLGRARSAAAATSEALTIRHGGTALAAVLDVPLDAAGDGMPPLAVVMHGLMGGKDEPIHRALARELTARGVATLRFDFNGHGSSSGRFRDMTLDNEVDDALAVIDHARRELGRTGLALVGHSQGAIVAAMVAARLGAAGAAPRALVLLAPPDGVRESALAGSILGNGFDPTDPPATLAMHPWGEYRVGRDYILAAQRLDLPAVLARIAAPALVIQGGADEIVSAGAAASIASMLTDGEARIVPGLDHGFYRDPATPARLAADFVAARAMAIDRG